MAQFTRNRLWQRQVGIGGSSGFLLNHPQPGMRCNRKALFITLWNLPQMVQSFFLLQA
jgi:hypothetical protein